MTKKSVIAIGTFDGMHRGHKFLINKTLYVAKKNNLKSVVITLEKPVKKVKGLLTTCEEKIEEIKFLGVDEVFILGVQSEILSYGPDKFFDEFLVKTLKVSEIVCGCDFAFGRNRKGDVEWLKRKTEDKNIKVNIVRPLRYCSRQISSSYIRTLIEKGDIKNAAKLLGRNYSFSGVPFKDKGIGKKLGFPTVNLCVDNDKLLPRGVYMSFVLQGERQYYSLTNIGMRSTFDLGKKMIPETHILDFKGVWKSLKTKVTLLKKIRNEKKFLSVEELKTQISEDVTVALRFFKSGMRR
ncbi:MAG: bifunctional riboflavin kinase/FAD synthetase [Endomicrobium sp.]|jgi:riboflavin kinase/FMN adenylyltransferase|nr:bifunctional riboflavin kinase/FAD synthetase [Endomicrobium sp.]